MISSSFLGLTGKTYTVDQEIGHGGEGNVSTITGNASLVLKIYNENVQKDKIEKLENMVSMDHADLFSIAAWPKDVVKNNMGVVCGFTMNKLTNYFPLHMLFSPMDRKKIFPDKGYNFLIHVARNLATAFHKLHRFGIIIGDVNEANILVNSSGMIAFIDCDSFQIQKGQKTYYCEVGVPRYTAPEILEHGSFENYVRTKNTDSFALATLIFQILFLGRAPFTGIYSGIGDFDEDQAIKAREFAYSLRSKTKRLLPAKNSLDIKIFPSQLVDLFHKAFEAQGIRPDAMSWIESLGDLINDLIVCKESKLHHYPRFVVNCPWCQFRKQQGLVYFLDDTYIKDYTVFDNIDHFVNGFKIDVIHIKQLSTEYRNLHNKPNPIQKKFRNLKQANRAILSFIWLLSLTLYFNLDGGIYLVLGCLFTWLFLNFSPTRTALTTELKTRLNQYNKAKSDFEDVVNNHNNPSQLSQHTSSSEKLRSLINRIKGLPKEFDKKKREVEEKNFKLAYEKFLRNFEISKYTIPSFGPNKKMLLYANGIRNAAEISRLHNMRIERIGPKNMQILFDWQRQIGSSFVYNPNVDIINRELSLVANEISGSKQRIEIEIKSEFGTLQSLKQSIENLTKSVEDQYDKVGTSLYQMQLDYEQFSKFNKL